MKTSRVELLSALRKLAQVKKPLGEMVAILADGNTIRFVATNLELELTTSCPHSGGETLGNVGTLSLYKKLIALLSKLKDKDVELSFTQGRMNLSHSKGTVNFKLDEGSFPFIHPQDEYMEYFLPANVVKRISAMSALVSKDELRPAMTGVLFTTEDRKLVAVTTDAHKLAKYETGIYGQGDYRVIQNTIVPSFVFPKLSKDVTIRIYQEHSVIEHDGDVYRVRNIDASYPNYNAVIPLDNPNSFEYNTESFKQMVTMSLMTANPYTGRMSLDAEAGVLHSADLDTGIESTLRVPKHSFVDDEYDLVFNGNKMLDALTLVEVGTFNLESSSRSRAMMIRENGITLLVMPIE